jgi:hypothetical protein
VFAQANANLDVFISLCKHSKCVLFVKCSYNVLVEYIHLTIHTENTANTNMSERWMESVFTLLVWYCHDQSLSTKAMGKKAMGSMGVVCC